MRVGIISKKTITADLSHDGETYGRKLFGYFLIGSLEYHDPYLQYQEKELPVTQGNLLPEGSID